MNKKSFKQKIVVIMIIIIAISIFLPQEVIKRVQASDDSIWEDFVIQMGTYNGKKINWRCVGNDENGRLMVCDTILCYKSYDAAFLGYSNSYRKKYGSNYWNGSCIKKWLNSSGEINWESTDAIPNINNIRGNNNYDNEQGFLNCFTTAELNNVKEVTQPTFLNNLDYYLANGGSSKFDFDANNKSFDTLFSTLANSNNRWYQNTTEKFFLLGPEQLKLAVSNVGSKYMSLESSYWLRLPCNTGMSYENLAIVKSGNVIGSTCAYNSDIGIRPAFYLDDSYVFENMHVTFDDAIYRANWLLGQKNLLDSAINGEQTPAEIIYNEAEASGLSTSSEAWQLLQDTLGAILDDPSGFLDKPLEKEQLYEGIIFAMFDASVDITIFPGENQAKKAVKETNSLLSLLKNVFKTKYDVDIADAFDAISLKPEYQKALHDTSEEYFKNLGISKASKFLSKINEAVTYFNNFEDYLKYEMDCMALMELGESYRDIMQAMYDACSWGNPDLKLALLDCVNIMDDTMEDLVTKIAAGTFISAGVSTVKVGIQTIWNDAKTQVVVSNPYVAIIWGSYKASTYFADKVFGASSIAEKTVKLGALNDIKPLTFAVYQDAKKAFESDRSRENAENYLEALDVAYRYLDQDCGTAKSFAETTSSALAARLISLFGADDGTDTVSKIGSIQNLYSDDFEILNIGWLYDLEVDYPDEYPNYEYLMTDWEKKYLVSCPVDVYVYDKNENLVASSVGNMPYVANDSKFTVSVLGDRKTIYSYENMDSYTFKYVSTGMGTMDVTIEENNRSNDYPRIVKHVGVPLAEGVSYKSLDDVASSSNSYELETVENSHILKPSFDSANNVSMRYKLSVSNGFLLDEGQFGIEGDFLTGEKISIYASVPKGYVFKEWVSDGEVAFENASALSTTVIMPNYAVVITATYESAGNDNGNGSSPSPSPSIAPPNSNTPSPSSSAKPSGSDGSGGGGFAGGDGGTATTPTPTSVVTLTPSPSPTHVTIATIEPTPKPSASTKPGTGSDSIFNNNSKREITPADVTLNKKTIIYSGKEKKPGVTVLSGSLELIKDKEYTVSYSYNINVGTAYVTVYGKGDYYGSVTKSFKIIPKGTPLKGQIKPRHKGFSVEWKKQSKSITGYQVQYSTDKKFKGKTTVIRTVKKKSVTKLTISKLKAKKKYYVRVRTYKTVKGKKYYSRWSKSKVVKTKK